MLDDLYHSLDPIAFSIGAFSVHWYGLGYIVGILLGVILVYRVAKRWQITLSLDNLLTIMIAAALGIFLGARLGYVLFYSNGYYLTHPLEVFAVWQGGMSFHGGVIGIIVAMAVAAKLLKVPYLTLTDLIVIGAPIGIFLVRCANFVNGELWGAPTDLPWGVVFDKPGDSGGAIARHPTQLYEAFLEGIVMFVVMYVLSRKVPARPRGTFCGSFLVLYGIFRILIEFVRQPDAQLGYLAGGWLTMGMVLSIPLILLGLWLLWFAHSKHKPQRGTEVPVVAGLEMDMIIEDNHLGGEPEEIDKEGPDGRYR